MIPGKDSLPDRDLDFIMYRLRWLDQEITRYRDFEWKATSFNAAFFTAVLYGILNKDLKDCFNKFKSWLIVAVLAYLFISCVHIIYIHMQLNKRRNEKIKPLPDRLQKPDVIPEDDLKPIKWGFCEGWGVIFPIGFLLSLITLAFADLAALGLSWCCLLYIFVPFLVLLILLILLWRKKIEGSRSKT